MRRPLALLAASTAIALALLGCPDSASWSLRGEIAILELREIVDSTGAKQGTLDYSIRNTGKAKIVSSRFALTFSTDRRTYRLTALDGNSIACGCLVYGQVTIAYVEAEESGSVASAVIDSTQFE